MEKVKSLITSATLKDTTVLAVGNMGSSLLAIVFTIVVARVLGPAEWGVAAGVISFITIVEAVGDFGLGASLFRFSSRLFAEDKVARANRLVGHVLFLRLVSALVILLIFGFAAPFITEPIFTIGDTRLGLAASLAISTYLLFDFQVFREQSQRNFKVAALLLVSSNFVRLFIVIFLISAQELTVLRLILVYALSPMLVFLVCFLHKPILPQLHKSQAHGMRSFVPFSGAMGVNRVLGVVAGRMDVLIVIQILSATDAGVFGAAKQLSLGVPLVIGSFATVLAPRFATLKGTALKEYFKKTVLLSVVLAIGVLSGVVFAPLVIATFGPSYHASLPILQLLLVGLVPFALATPAVNLLIYAFGKPWIITYIAFVQVSVVVCGNLLFLPEHGVVGAVYVQAIVNTLLFVLVYLFVWREMRK